MIKERVYKIGFGGKYWTFWNVWSEKVKTYNGLSEEFHFDYIQNLSLDLETAKKKFLEKTNGAEIVIDENLKGQSFIHREVQEYVAPNDDEFKIGRNKGCKLTETDDLKYLKWYYFNNSELNPTTEFIKAFEKQDVVFSVYFSFKKINVDESAYNTFSPEIKFFETEEEKSLYIQNYKYVIMKEMIKEIDGEHGTFFYEDKEKIEKKVILMSSDSVNTYFGEMNTYVFYCEEDNTQIIYAGSKTYDIKQYEIVTIKGTIKHNFNKYHMKDETKVLRMKIIK